MEGKKGIYERFIKRPMDFVLALFALIVLSPLLLITAILVRIKIGSPVVFKQQRPGKNEKLFTIYKFRTMSDALTRDGRKLTDNERLKCIEVGIDVSTNEERLTRAGRLLRATSIDELPELWNILIGNMSIVGPRPLATIYLPFYTEEEQHRHDVRPGLTGLAQVHGRNSVSWENRFKYDIEYVKHITILNDIKIICKTIFVVFARKDIGQGTESLKALNIVRQTELDKTMRISVNR